MVLSLQIVASCNSCHVFTHYSVLTIPVALAEKEKGPRWGIGTHAFWGIMTHALLKSGSGVDPHFFRRGHACHKNESCHQQN